MTTIDLINRLAAEHNLTAGRSEMIISIVVERITERLKSDGIVKVDGFGEFKLVKNSPSDMIMSEKMLNKNRIAFEPEAEFLEKINPR